MTALRAEWIKLRTVPSTGWALAALVAGTVLFTALVCATASSGGCAPDTCHDYVVVYSLNGVFVGQIAVVALGVLVIGSEYSTTIRTTFAAEPRRRRVLLAKVLDVAALAFVGGLATALLAFNAGRSLLSDSGYPSLTVADGLVPVAVIALYLTALALFSLGVGAVLRSTAAAVTFVLSVLLLPLIAAPLLGERTGEQVLDVAPMSAGLSFLRSIDRVESLTAGEWTGLGVMWLWAVAALGLALVAGRPARCLGGVVRPVPRSAGAWCSQCCSTSPRTCAALRNRRNSTRFTVNVPRSRRSREVAGDRQARASSLNGSGARRRRCDRPRAPGRSARQLPDPATGPRPHLVAGGGDVDLVGRPATTSSAPGRCSRRDRS